MSWKLASADHTVTLDLNAGDNGSLGGTFTCQGVAYATSGSWAASYSVPGRKYSAFSLSGRTAVEPANLIAVAGIMTGPGGAPTQIDVRITVSSSLNGTIKHLTGVLLPSA